MSDLQIRYKDLLDTLKSISTNERVKIVAAIKKIPLQRVKEVINLGVTDLGENFLNEALERRSLLGMLAQKVTWHFIGRIQSNKAAQIATHFDWVQSLDSLKVATKLNRSRLDHSRKPLQVLIQINVDDENTKAGVSLEEAPRLAKAIEEYSGLQLRGIMSLPKIRDSEFPPQNSHFDRLNSCFKSLQRQYPHIDTVSVGTSNDWQAAVQNGSTMIRLGTSLMGQRE